MFGKIVAWLKFWHEPKTSESKEQANHAKEQAEASRSNKHASTTVKADSPILEPEEDIYGIDGFAQAIAKSIRHADASNGLVFAVNGPWGSGKSSACNLILHHLSKDEKAGLIKSVSFNPWWFSGAEALTSSFFQELNASIGKSLTEEARLAMETLGARFSSVGPLLGGVVNLFAIPGVGAAVEKAAGYTEKLTKVDRSVETQHLKLAKALIAQNIRFLVVIDDIDRLSTDEALQIFRLIKSVGRLPNVIYLLAYDKQMAEKMISERFPSEGPSYLEKIVQAAFDLPVADKFDLRRSMLKFFDQHMAPAEQDGVQRFMNMYFDITDPLLRTPRDVVRLENVLKVDWSAVKDDVNAADFVSIEALRTFLPDLYLAIRQHKGMLCGNADDRLFGRRNRDDDLTRYNAVFLSGLKVDEQEVAKNALQRMFPRTRSIWSNVIETDSDTWRKEKRICSDVYFENYFSYSFGTDHFPEAEFKQFLENAGNHVFVTRTLIGCCEQKRRKGGTRAAVLLEELTVRQADIPDEDIPELLRGVFEAADIINVEEDQSRGFSIRDNRLRIHWLLNKLIIDRFDLEKRSELIGTASPYSPLNWLEEISSRCWTDHQPRDGNEPSENPIVDKETASTLRKLFRDRIRAAAKEGALSAHKDIISILYRWRDATSSEEVRHWTDEQLEQDEFVVLLASQLVTTGWSHSIGIDGLGDRVPSKSEYRELDASNEIINAERLLERVKEISSAKSMDERSLAVLNKFLSTPDRTVRA